MAKTKTAYATPEEALAARVHPEGECLIWEGAKIRTGYGQLGVGGGKMMLVHRFAYQMEHGAIPEGMVVHHTCYRRDCVRVDHLRAISQKENTRDRSVACASNATTGIRGVTRHRSGGYRARVTKDGKVHQRYCGTLEAAVEAVNEMRAELFGEFAGTQSVAA